MLLFPKLLGTLASFKLSNLIFTVFSTHIKLIIAFHACFFSQFPLKIVLSYWSLKCFNSFGFNSFCSLSYFLTNRNLLSLTRDPHESFLILISIMIKTLKGLKHLLYKRLRAPRLFCLRNGKPWGNLYLVYKYLVGMLRILRQMFLSDTQGMNKRQRAQIKTQQTKKST